MKKKNESKQKESFSSLIAGVIVLDVFALVLISMQIMIKDISYILHAILILCNIFVFVYIYIKKKKFNDKS